MKFGSVNVRCREHEIEEKGRSDTFKKKIKLVGPAEGKQGFYQTGIT